MRLTRTVKWGLVILFWLGWSAACTSFSYSFRVALHKPIAWMDLSRMYFAAYTLWGPLFTPIAVFIARRFQFEKPTWPRSLIVHFFAAPSIACIHASICVVFSFWIWPEMAAYGAVTKLQMFQRYFLMYGTDNIFIYWTIVLAVQGWMYYERYRDRELRASVLQTQLATAQLQALKVQLHPHFLFNTLNSVSELMHQDVNTAERVITRLSDLLRMALENIGVQELSLRQELDFVQGYLEIEQTRFLDRLEVKLDIQPETLDCRIPNLLLQPLVENAIRHGISKSSGLGVIEIFTRKINDRLLIVVTDNGPGIASNGRHSTSNFGLGLSTTRTRLEFLYGREQTFVLNNLPDRGLEVRISLPWHHQVATQVVVSPSLTFSPELRPIPEGVR
jgi:two-component system, LytTR family, sensor kinase